MRNPLAVSLSLAASVVLIFCNTPQAIASPDRTELSAKKTYVFRNYLKDDAITITTSKDSVVTLTGTVTEWSHQSLAEETVSNLPGVKRVVNKLEAKNGRPVENSDGWIAMKIKSVLMFHRNVSSANTTVEVKNGAVTLSGEAASLAQKELTTEYVKDIEGVVTVANNLTIVNKEKNIVEKVGENIDDVSITVQVKNALLFHRSTSALKTKVTVKDGIVTLGGVAKNSAEKDLAGKLVNNIQGVNGLKNDMTIE